MKSYEDRFFANLDQEIDEFREKTIARPPKEIYDDATRISFYEYMDDYLRCEKFTTEQYKTFLESDKDFIGNLWRKSLNWIDFNVGSVTDASCLVETYVADIQAHSNPDCM